MTNQATSQGWDFFIAHAGVDREIAETLYELLAPHCRTFLDSKCLVPGDDWDRELPKAQKSARVSVILISQKTPEAYYQREEITAAISLARKQETKHRVVPVYLAGATVDDDIPYGLHIKHGLFLKSASDISVAAEQLLALVKPEVAISIYSDLSNLTDDETAAISQLFQYSGSCAIGAAVGEYESVWMPSFLVDMQWGWERTAQYIAETGKALGDRVERLRWIFVVRDLASRGYLEEEPKSSPRKTTYYHLTEKGWRTGLKLATAATKSQK